MKNFFREILKNHSPKIIRTYLKRTSNSSEAHEKEGNDFNSRLPCKNAFKSQFVAVKTFNLFRSELLLLKLQKTAQNH